MDLKLGQDMERILGLEVGVIHWHLKALPPRDLLLMKGQQLLNRRGRVNNLINIDGFFMLLALASAHPFS